MLSEKRQKVKYSTDPNGNLWANNTNGFGRQMLQRMGWSPGKGLGKDETGIRAPIKASAQRGTRGLGMKSDYTLGSKQMDEYANLLRALNASCSSSSLKRSHSTGELKDSIDKSGTHLYKKIIKAKDASQYDKQALSIILGGTAEYRDSSEVSSAKVETEDTSSSFVKVVNSSLNMHEYFEKMKLRKSSLNSTASEDYTDKTNSPFISKSGVVLDNEIHNFNNRTFDLDLPRESNHMNGKDFSNDSVFYGTNLLTIPGYACY